MSHWQVLKFGGTSVSSAAHWQQIAHIIEKKRAEGVQVAVVHSAAAGLTNALEALCHGATDAAAQVESLVHSLAASLGSDGERVAHWLDALRSLSAGLEDDHDQAELLALGERITHDLALRHLREALNLKIESLDPKDILCSDPTDRRHTSSRVLSAQCRVAPDAQLQNRLPGPCVLMPGYIARDAQDRTVVLGRGGGDTSAAYLAVLLNAEKLEIWTDVHGIFSANPRIIPGARLLEKLSYVEAREIAASGGKVLHPRSILPVEQFDIPLQIRHTGDIEFNGTTLHRDYASSYPRIRAINTRHQITLVSMESINMWQQSGFLGQLFDVYRELGLSIDLISTAQTNVTVSLDASDNVIHPGLLEQLKSRLESLCTVQIVKNCSAVTLVGHRIRALADQIAPAISAFSDQRIYMITQSSNDLNQSIVVDEDQADKLTRALHEALITGHYKPEDFGPSWHELNRQMVPQTSSAPPWWREHATQLLALAQESAPCYVYHLPTVAEQIERLQSLHNVDRIFYAMKANNHPALLRLMHACGVGLETVSPGEIQRVHSAIPDVQPDHMLFTPNFAPRSEYRDAVAAGLHVTIDNIFILRHWGELFSGHAVILRLDPGHGSGHHRYVRTAGEQSKFGIHASEIAEVIALCRQHNIRVHGLHSHTGSGILNYENWQRIAAFLTAQLAQFPEARVINIGGGMGVRENPGDAGLNLAALDDMLQPFKAQHPDLEIWIEPGRFLVAHCGVLLARVTQTKWKGRQGYIGLETGMNSLIRPALYGAWHNIVNLSKLDAPLRYQTTVVGPMCETGDVLGIDRAMPETEAGDVMLIANTGAYARAMASAYNLRDPAAEFVLT